MPDQQIKQVEFTWLYFYFDTVAFNGRWVMVPFEAANDDKYNA